MSIIERIKEYIDFKGISKYRFYQDTGISNGFLDKDSNIGSDKCERIIYQYPEINSDWLLTGNGEMLKSESASSSLITHSGVFNDSTISSMVNSGRMKGDIISNSDSKKKDEKKSQTEKENIKLKEENRLFKLQIELQNKLLEDKERIIEEKERLIQALLNKN